MRLGLLCDIHEDVRRLRLAIQRLNELKPDRYVVLGDVVRDGRRLDETVDLLIGINAAGVWGNHDVGLCLDPDERDTAAYDPATRRHLAGYQPSLTIDGYFFQHIQPQRDPRSLEDLWLGGSDIPDTSEKAAACFETPHRVALLGHYHRWLCLTQQGPRDWIGERPVSLAAPERFVVIVDAVENGRCSLLDTGLAELIPIDLADDE